MASWKRFDLVWVRSSWIHERFSEGGFDGFMVLTALMVTVMGPAAGASGGL